MTAVLNNRSRRALVEARARIDRQRRSLPVVRAEEKLGKHRVKRWLLRACGMPRAAILMLFDERRYSVTVSHHATVQAHERYGNGSPVRILADVTTAMEATRVGVQVPGQDRFCRHGAYFAWSEDATRVYVMRRAYRGWIVITSLPYEA